MLPVQLDCLVFLKLLMAFLVLTCQLFYVIRIYIFNLLLIIAPRRSTNKYGAIHCHSEKSTIYFYSLLYRQVLTQYDKFILGQNVHHTLRVSI